MSKDDDLFFKIEKNLENEYHSEYLDALIEYDQKNPKKQPQIKVIGQPEPEETDDQEEEVVYETRKKRRPRPELPEEEEKSPRPPKKHKFLKRVLIVLAVLVLLVFGIHGLLTAYVSKTDYQPYETDYVRASDVKESAFVTNILIVGCDARNTDEDSRSDAIIIASINRAKGKIVLTSILRDTYVDIPGYGGNKINAAFQYGGADLLIQTIEENFKVGIDYYVKIDFFSFVNIIDDMGGVTIDVDDEELPYVNSYLNEINSLLSYPVGDSYLTTSGVQTLNGRQALSYSRIRYVGTDFARTSRQREVINALITSFKSEGIPKMISSANTILPELTTNISDSKMAWYIMESPLFLTYDMEEFRIPADDTWTYETIDGLDAIRVDFDANSKLWQEAVY